MAGNPFQQGDICFDIDGFSQHFDAFCTVKDDSSQCTGSLISGKKNCIVFIPEPMLQMMANSSAFAHPAGCYDDLVIRVFVQPLGFLRGCKGMQTFKPDGVFPFVKHPPGILIQAFQPALQKNSRCFIGKRTVHINRKSAKFGQTVSLFDFPEEI